MQLDRRRKWVELAVNPLEIELANAVTSPSVIGELPNSNNDVLIEVVAAWRYRVGIMAPDVQEIIEVAKFIKSNYKELTVDEIKLAIDLSLTRRFGFDVDVKVYGVFSCLYVGGILDAYAKYKKIQSNNIAKRQPDDVDNDSSLNKGTPEENMEFHIEYFKSLYKQVDEKDDVYEMISFGYNFLERTNRISFTDEEKNASRDYADDKLVKKKAADRAKHESFYVKPISEHITYNSGLSDSSFIKKYSKNWYVLNFIKNNSYDIFINNIKLEEFA